jgi:hypothetical protein
VAGKYVNDIRAIARQQPITTKKNNSMSNSLKFVLLAKYYKEDEIGGPCSILGRN